jgi:hypothetical protein
LKYDRHFQASEIFTAVTMKNAVFWYVAPCSSCVNRRFGGTYRLHIQGRKIREQSAATCSRYFLARGFSTMKIEAIRSSETSVHTITTRHHIQKKSILHAEDGLPIKRNMNKNISPGWSFLFSV